MCSTLACTIATALIWSPVPPQLAITAAARSIQPGELIVLTIAMPQPASSVRVQAFGAEWLPFRIDAQTWRVLIGIDLDVPPGPHDVTVDAESSGGAISETYPLIVKPRMFRTRNLTVLEAFVNPPPAVQGRIEEEVALLTRTWQSSADAKLWSGPFIRPVPGPANSAFGSRSTYNGQPRSPHGGADFQSPDGTPIKAPNAGRVVLARELYFTGNTVIIDHGLGLFSLLAHMSVVGVREGSVVRAGEEVGRVGATGRVTGAHLHWTVRAGDARVDPLSLLALLGETPAARRGRKR